MSSDIIALTCEGLTPALRHASAQLNDDIWKAIERATDVGMPVGLLIGQIEFIKHAIIDQHFAEVKANG